MDQGCAPFKKGDFALMQKGMTSCSLSCMQSSMLRVCCSSVHKNVIYIVSACIAG